MEDSKTGNVILQIEMPKEFCDLVASRVVEQLSNTNNIQKTQNDESTQKLSTGDEVEKFFRISKSTLKKWREQGKIPYSQVNGYYYYDLKKIVKGLEVPAKSIYK